jgi:hypothetical protein
LTFVGCVYGGCDGSLVAEFEFRATPRRRV